MSQAQISDRISLPEGVGKLRSFFGLFGRLAPAYAAARFWQAFSSPKRSSLKPPHEQLLAQATLFDLPATCPVTAPGAPIRHQGYIWHQAGTKTILLLHGWSGKVVDYYKMIPGLVAAGYRVEGFDFSGHGLSDGTRCSAIDMRSALEAYLTTHREPYAIIGHSLGAGVAAFYLEEHKLPIKRLALLASPVKLRYAFEDAFTIYNVPGPAQSRVYQLVEQRLGVDLDRYDLSRIGEIPAYRTMALYVHPDEEVPAAHIQAFLAEHPEVEGHLISSATHNLIMRDAQAITKVLEFLV